MNSNSNIQFRPIEPQDNPAMAHVIRIVMTEYGAVGEGYSINDPEVDRMYETYTQKGSHFLVITKAGQVLGGGGIAPLEGGDPSICELKKMYFLSEIRGQGLGRRLVLECLDAARSLGYQKCYLETVERMQRANILYQKLGFRRLDNALGCTGHSSCDAWYVLNL